MNMLECNMLHKNVVESVAPRSCSTSSTTISNFSGRTRDRMEDRRSTKVLAIAADEKIRSMVERVFHSAGVDVEIVGSLAKDPSLWKTIDGRPAVVAAESSLAELETVFEQEDLSAPLMVI